MFAYVGSRTTRERNARGEGISVFRLDTQQRRLEQTQLLGDLVNPSFLAMNSAGTVLYTVHGDGHEVSSFKVDPSDGNLKLLNREDCQGRNPVHLALDPSERYLIVSNHLSGTVAVMPLARDGSIQPVQQLAKCEGTPGPHRIEQPFAKPHFNPFDPSGRFVAVPDKGLDKIFTFEFLNGRLEPTSPAAATSREGSGPRHLAFHAARPMAYAVNELDSTVTAYRFDVETGTLAPVQILSTLPDTFTGNSRASEIAIDGGGGFVYASNRGFDSIALFAVTGEGTLKFIEAVETGGKTPRFFALTPNQRTLFALNEDSDSIVAMAVSDTSGRLSKTGIDVHCRSPVCMVFSPQER
ncbi:lactonase family protein [Variovorax sp. J22R133]|nr:lactonase family protein [Variovorax sp. J22R133]MDM0114135.1 lactonase family protein [Variovorax sp. J22R133]